MTRSSSRSLRRAKSGILREHLALEREALGALVVLGVALAEAHEDGGDVVLAAPLVGELDERLGRGVAVLSPRYGLELVGVLEVAVQAVEREEELVAGEHLDHERVDLDALVDADRAGDGVLLRDLLDLLARELAALDELVEDGVVLGDLLDPAVAQQVDAAVADVGDEAVRADDEQRRERRAHAALAGVGLASSWMRAQARCTACSSRFEDVAFVTRRRRSRRLDESSMSSLLFLISSWMVRTAMALATSPAAWPPMPSATMKSASFLSTR